MATDTNVFFGWDKEDPKKAVEDAYRKVEKWAAAMRNEVGQDFEWTSISHQVVYKPKPDMALYGWWSCSILAAFKF